VKQWITEELKIDEKHGEVLVSQDVTGSVLRLLTIRSLIDMGVTYGPAIQIMHALKEKNILIESTSEAAGQEESSRNPDEKSFMEMEDKGKTKDEGKGDSKSGVTSELQDPTLSEFPKTLDSAFAGGTKSKLGQENNKSNKTLENNQHPTKQTCLPYPFDEFHDSHRYIQHYILHPPETGPLNLIDPAHEFKLFTNTENATEENIKLKFCNEIFRFAAACMNSRNNGTIHLGVKDDPHGEINGVKVNNKDKFIDYFDSMIQKYFKALLDDAKNCIRKPRFVEVLLQNNTPSDTFVIEVDVVPKYSICESKFYKTMKYNVKKKTWEPSLFVRDGASSPNILETLKEKSFMLKLKRLAESRKTAEEEHGEKRRKRDSEGPKLVRLLTGNKDLLDNSYYDWYILVTNKCHTSQTQHLDFLQELTLFAVLEFDPESASNGVVKTYREKRAANLHFPNQYQDKGKTTSETIESLNLYQQPSWIFGNGRSDLNSDTYQSLDPSTWQQEKAAEVRKLICFLSDRDIMQRGKFLVVFLLLSKVEDPGDPMIEAFCAFYQELNGLEDMLCICIGAQTYQRWKGLLQARLVSVEALTDRCISNLSLEMVNGSILKLKSMTQSSQRLLPSKGSSTILLKKKEDFMTALEILCENECKDTEIEKDKVRFSEFKKSHEEHFYRGGKVSWWNFYYSDQNYSLPFIKRDSYGKLHNLIQESSKQTSTKIINLYHHPGCGGTTLAMHVLWELREEFRCAVLKNRTVDFAEIGAQLTMLITYGATNQSDYLPVLLLVDDFEEQETVYILQNAIQSAITEKGIRYENPLVIILNCMRSQNPQESSKSNSLNSVALKHKLSDKEQRAFEEKLKEIEEQYDHPEDFYSFMIMKTNFNHEYIENVVKNTLKGLDVTNKQAKLIFYLALLNSYVTDSTISVSQCEEFLGITAKKAYWGHESLEDKMGTCSNIIIQTEVQECGRYKGARISHPLIAKRCLEEFKQTYNLTKSEITLQLLREILFYDCGLGRDKVQQDVQNMLLMRQRKEHGDEADTLFSPLIEAIQKEEGSAGVESVLIEGTFRFNHNAFICQALARHFYIQEKNFVHALEWAKKAKNRAPNNSYITDTLGQIYKSQIKCWLEGNAQRFILIADELKRLLELAKLATEAFKKSQEQTEQRDNERENFQNSKSKRRYEVYNTSGYLGEIETGLYTIDILELSPFFNKNDALSRKEMIQYLSGNVVNSFWNIKNSEEFRQIFKDYPSYICNLQENLKKAFDFFENYFVFLKSKNPEKEIVELKIRNKVRELFNKYAQIFCHSDLEQLKDKQMSSKLSLALQVESYRKRLVASKADMFSGLLEYLSNHEKAANKMEDIVENYRFLLERSKYRLRDRQNFILANIVLNCIKPKSKRVHSVQELKAELRKILQKVPQSHQYPDPYFLASLLFWPENQKQLDEDSRQMEKYVTSLRRYFRGHYGHMCRSKHSIAHFYLGKDKGLNRLVQKGKIDQCVDASMRDLSSLWQSGAIWKKKDVQDLLLRLKGKAEDNYVYIDYDSDGKISIPVRPVFLGQIKSGQSIERVSFYLGFSLEGLIAYDIEIM
uniref:SAM9L protein n=1 Tax=Sphenodon punctatus TaxID=8508 RepID=A0A8D0GBJ0_SPHPU